MTSLALEFVSVFGLSPVALAHLAADLGFKHFTTVLQPFGQSILGHPSFSLREDAALRRELHHVMRDRGVSLSLGEGIAITEDVHAKEAYPRDLEIMQTLGIRRINVVSLDPDLARTFDQLADLTELASGFGIETLIEFVPIFTVADLSTAYDAVRHVGRPDCRIMFDTMHFCRSGSQVSDLAALDLSMIGYIQLCDVPLRPSNEDYMDEAVHQRAAPGDGDLPLRNILRALPRDRVVGLEIPLRAEALAGQGDHERISRCIDAALAILPDD